MAERIERVTSVEEPAVAAPATSTRATREVAVTSVGGATLAARVVWYIAGVLLVLLGFRFVLALLGANTSNGFANFIYSASHPFVAPFFSLFGYNLRYGVSRFETYTLIAMVVYAIVAFGIVRLLTIANPDRDAAV